MLLAEVVRVLRVARHRQRPVPHVPVAFVPVRAEGLALLFRLAGGVRHAVLPAPVRVPLLERPRAAGAHHFPGALRIAHEKLFVIRTVEIRNVAGIAEIRRCARIAHVLDRRLPEVDRHDDGLLGGHRSGNQEEAQEQEGACHHLFLYFWFICVIRKKCLKTKHPESYQTLDFQA